MDEVGGLEDDAGESKNKARGLADEAGRTEDEAGGLEYEQVG